MFTILPVDFASALLSRASV